MSTPSSRYSTPSGTSQEPRSTKKTPRAASYAPGSSGMPSARSGGGIEGFLSPVSMLNRNKEKAMKEQEARMKNIEDERAQRLASKHGSRMSTPAAPSSQQSSAKRKLTELEAAVATASSAIAQRSSSADKAKKIRTTSPSRRPADAMGYAATATTTATTTATASARRVSMHGNEVTGISASARRVTMHGGEMSSVKTEIPLSKTASLSASALKRHDQRHSHSHGGESLKDRVSAATASDASERYLAYEKQVDHMRKAEAAPSTPPQSHRSTSGGPQGLFARHADRSVQKTPPESTSSSPFKFPGYESSVASSSGSPLPVIHTPPRPSRDALPIQLLPRGDDGMVDLDRVSTVSQLETLEGDDILSAMMKLTTPRVDRHFPSEHARTTSEEREIQFLRRRRLAGKSKDPVVTKNLLKTSWSFDEVLEPVASPSTGAVRRGVVSKEAQQARDDAENAKATAAENDTLLDGDDDDDDETTESKVERFSRATRWSLRRFIIWMVAGASLICALDVGFLLFLSLFAPPKPFCDNNTSMLGEMGGERAALTLIGGKSEVTALQRYRDDCRACPLFGICSEGVLVSCLPPLEQRNGACVESKEVQHALEQIAKSIEKYVVDKATSQVCGVSRGLPSTGASSSWRIEELSGARVMVLLSELRELVLQSPFAETLMNISLEAVAGNAAAEFVFNRSLDLALSSLHKIAQVVSFEHVVQFVGTHAGATERSDMLIQFSTSIAPFSCRARNQLATHAHLIALAVAALALAMFSYRRWLVVKTQRALVDRLVKEARYFLIGRLQRSEHFFPADHLRDNLFDTLPSVPLRDRKWLRECVWPKVATLLSEDSRVHSYIASIHGKEMVVWQWIASATPSIPDDVKRRVRMRDPRKRYSI